MQVLHLFYFSVPNSTEPETFRPAEWREDAEANGDEDEDCDDEDKNGGEDEDDDIDEDDVRTVGVINAHASVMINLGGGCYFKA